MHAAALSQQDQQQAHRQQADYPQQEANLNSATVLQRGLFLNFCNTATPANCRAESWLFPKRRVYPLFFCPF